MENLKNKLIIRKSNLEIYEYINDSRFIQNSIEIENIRNNKSYIINKIYFEVLPTLDDFTDKAELYIDKNFNIICTIQRKQGYCWSYYEDLKIDRQENKNYFESEDKIKFVPISLRYNSIKINTINEKRKKIVSHINEIRNNQNRII